MDSVLEAHHIRGRVIRGRFVPKTTPHDVLEKNRYLAHELGATN